MFPVNNCLAKKSERTILQIQQSKNGAGLILYTNDEGTERVDVEHALGRTFLPDTLRMCRRKRA